jgi:hypothetical protein
MEARKDIFGYFDEINQNIPAHDPGINTICPICAKKLENPLSTISFFVPNDKKSYFYRIHKQCGIEYPDAESDIESSIVDSVCFNKSVHLSE